MSDWISKQEEYSPKTGGPLPVGDYAMKIIGIAEKETRDGTGKFVEVELVVTGGEHDGRKLKTRYNVANASEEATRIGMQQWLTMLRAAGFITPKQAEKNLPADVALMKAGLLQVRKFASFQEVKDAVEGRSVWVRTKIVDSKDGTRQFAEVASVRELDTKGLGDEIKQASSLPV